MTHLTPDELVDAAEGTLGANRRTHVEQCAACGEEAGRLRAAFRAAQELAVPEPSPLFWTHFSARVRAAIDADDAKGTTWLPSWLGWRVVAPIGMLAIVIFALATAVPREPLSSPGVIGVVENASGPAVDLAEFGEREWSLLSDIVGPVDLDAAQDAGFVTLGAAERAALQLSAAERHELLRLLQEEIDKVGG